MPIILKDEILNLANGSLKLLGDKFHAENLEACSYDLRVGAIFKGKEIFSEEFPQSTKCGIVDVKPSEIVTILTLEEVNLPVNICATVFAINRLSSKGFLILNPGHIDPGYQGPVSICAINLSRETIPLELSKTEIFTIVFDKLDKDSEGYANNKSYKSSIERQKSFSVERARKLSTNIFDLIKLHDYKEHLINLISEVFFRKFIAYMFIIAGIIGIVAAYFQIAEYFNQEGKLMEQEQIINIKTDSLNYYKKQIDSLSKIQLNSKK